MTTVREKTGQFAPGESGNPGGRPKGLSRMVQEKTKNGAEIVNFYYRVFKGTHPKFTKPEHRLEAAEWLADRGWGKATQQVDMVADVTVHDDSALEKFQHTVLTLAARAGQDGGSSISN